MLVKGKTIDHAIQDQIKKAKEHWRKILQRLISVVRILAKQNLAFRGSNEKLYDDNNGNFMTAVEMIAEWDLTMKEHLERQGLFEELQNALKSFDLDIDNVRGQGYDNGENMKGRHQGVQKKLLHINPRALYIPCGLTLKPLSTTRWESRIESVKAVVLQAQKIREALLQVAEERNTDSKIRSEAKSLATFELENFEFLVGMHRKPGFEQAINTAKELASTMDIDPIFPEKRQIYRKRHFDEVTCESSRIPRESAEKDFRIHYFLYIVDQTIGSLKKKFEQYEEYEDIFGFHFTAEKLSSLVDEDLKARCKNLKMKLQSKEGTGQDASNLDGDDLYQELKIIQYMLPKETKTACEILVFLQRMNCFPYSFIAYRILLIIPVTVASAERSFSKLKLLKSCLRSTMTQTRLNALAMISIESEFLEKLDYEILMDDFADKNARRWVFHR
ncbi:uncharacterized protein LOC142510766 [Primulina tabacum]|uniref:uncharacterized protein LOC142510766 n=1 Tax=Primulina tabacum TaxID=48773 RepID=UPI003F5AAD21